MTSRDIKPQTVSTVDSGTGGAEFSAEGSNKLLRSLKTRSICAALIFISSLSVYLVTLAPTVTLVDSGELIVAARYLGVAHAPGFPLYVLLAHLASIIPLGSVAQRVNFASGLFAAGASALVGLAVAEGLLIPRRKPPATTQAERKRNRTKKRSRTSLWLD